MTLTTGQKSVGMLLGFVAAFVLFVLPMATAAGLAAGLFMRAFRLAS